MAERDVIVRCPGCGNGKVITLAVGQLLQCDLCRTTFHAPVDLSRAPGETADGDAFGAGPPRQPGAAPDMGDRRVHQRSPTDSTRDAAAKRASVTRSRSWRTDDLDFSIADPPTPIGDPSGSASQSQPPPAARPTSVPVGEDVSTAQRAFSGDRSDAPDADEELVLIAPREWIWTVISLVAGSVIVVTFLLGGYFLLRGPSHVGSSRDGMSTTKDEASVTQSADERWTDASHASQRRDSVLLKIERATYGSVRARDLQGQVITTEDDNLLAVTISVRNLGPRAREFQNWYGHAFLTGEDVEVIAELLDDQQRSYALLKFDDVSRIEGQRLAQRIEPKQTVQDALVFLIPREIDRTAIDFFRLKLPGAAVGMNDFFRFHIPVSMIEGFGD